MVSAAVWMFRRLEGLFCVYKPPGVHWKLIRDRIEMTLLKDLNATPAGPLPREVRFLQLPAGDSTAAVALTATSVPALSKHSLVTGPAFQRVRVGVGHRLDAFSSGVLVLGFGSGNRVLNEFYKERVTREYTVEGEFGKATDDFSHNARVIERSTYDHISQDKLERVLAMMQGANQKALLMYSNVDMKSQEAYEMAVQGLLGPEGKSQPILTGLRCIRFEPPNFTLEVQCLNETQRYLRKTVHEIGLELRSTAVCKGVRRTRDGPFTLQDALTHQQWNTKDIMHAIKLYHSVKKKKKKSRSQSKNSELQTQGENLRTDCDQKNTSTE